MIYSSFENVMSPKRMRRYLYACRGDKSKALTLYRLNLRLSQELFTIISCYEVALRNAIDRIMCSSLGEDWLRDAIMQGGIFDDPLFSKVFPKKPKSSSIMQYNNLFIYNELDAVNRLRNRIAHHEPICFMQDQEKISTVYILNCYHRIIKLFEWMDIDSKSLLYGLDHVNKLTSKIEDIAPSPTHRPK